MIEVTLSSKNQIVIPRQARQALELKAGDKLLMVTHGSTVIVFHKPKAHQQAIRGLARGSYPKGYLPKERTGWG